MTLKLPDFVKRELREQYENAIKACVQDYPHRLANEDGLTAVMGNKLEEAVQGGLRGYVWATKAIDLGSSRARNQHEEPDLGADMILEISYRTPRGRSRVKTLLIQAKKRGDYDKPRLSKQCEAMEGLPNGHGRHIVVEYSEGGYTAIGADAVKGRDGSIAKSRELGKPLQEALGGEFLQCRIGQLGVYYDIDSRRLRIPGNPDFKIAAKTVVETKVVRRRQK